jgi:hypothetical protein
MAINFRRESEVPFVPMGVLGLVVKYEDGGAMIEQGQPSETSEDPMVKIQSMAAQALQENDGETALEVCHMLLEFLDSQHGEEEHEEEGEEMHEHGGDVSYENQHDYVNHMDDHDEDDRYYKSGGKINIDKESTAEMVARHKKEAEKMKREETTKKDMKGKMSKGGAMKSKPNKGMKVEKKKSGGKMKDDLGYLSEKEYYQDGQMMSDQREMQRNAHLADLKRRAASGDMKAKADYDRLNNNLRYQQTSKNGIPKVNPKLLRQDVFEEEMDRQNSMPKFNQEVNTQENNANSYRSEHGMNKLKFNR